MGKNKERSRSGSRGRGKKDTKSHKHKDYRDRSDSRSRDRKNRRRSTSRERYTDKFSGQARERKSKFDTNAAGEHVERRSKWSDQPVKAIAPNPKNVVPAFDPNQISIRTSTINDDDIQINPNGSNPHSSLQEHQAQLFETVLTTAKFDPQERPNVHIEDVRPVPQPVIEDNQGFTIHSGGQGNDNNKLRRKIFVPKDGNFNYTGLIIGPKGSNQKRLEEISGCKILVRGRGSQKEGQAPQHDDNEDQHVLIVGDSEMQIAKATAEIERILFADEDTRIKIRQEQLKMVAQLKNDPNYQPGKQPTGPVDLSLTTPYGPPSPNAFVIPVPNDCVGLVIGKGGETIKMLQLNSGAKRVQVAADSAPGSGSRNVFVEGERESYERVKKMVEEIIEQQKRNRAIQAQNQLERVREEVVVPNNLVGLVIGKGGESVKNIMAQTGASIFIPKECEPGTDNRVLIVSGKQDQINHAKEMIFDIVDNGQRNLAMKALQAQGLIPPTTMMGMNGMDNPVMAAYYQQVMMMGMDPNYAAAYQQMVAQQLMQQQQSGVEGADGQAQGDASAQMDQNAIMAQYQMMMMMQMQNGGGQPGADGQMPNMEQYQQYMNQMANAQNLQQGNVQQQE